MLIQWDLDGYQGKKNSLISLIEQVEDPCRTGLFKQTKINDRYSQQLG